MTPSAINRTASLRLSLTDKIRLIATLPAIIALLLLAVSLLEFQLSGETLDHTAKVRTAQLKANLLQMRARACYLSEALFVADAGLRCPTLDEVRADMKAYFATDDGIIGVELAPELLANIEAMASLSAHRSELEMQRLGVSERLYESSEKARSALKSRGTLSEDLEVLLAELEQAGMTGGEHVPSSLVVTAVGRFARAEERRGNTELGKAHGALLELRSLAAAVGGIETEGAVLYARASTMISEKWNPALFANLEQIQARAQADRLKNLYNLLGVALLASLLAVGLGIYLSKTLARPFERLRAALRNDNASDEEMADDLQGLADAHERLSEARSRQKQLDERLVLLGRALDEAPSGVIITHSDPMRAAIYANRRFREITGWSADDLKKLPALKLFNDNNEQLDDLRQVAVSGGTATVTHEDARKDGKSFQHRQSVSAMYDAEGKISHFIGIHDDVSSEIEEARRLEEALQRSQLYAQALDSAASGVVITDPRLPDNPIIYVNRRFTEMTGYSREEAVGQNCRFLNARERNQPELKKLRDALASTVEVDVQLRNFRKDGSLFHNRLRISELHDAAGAVTHFIGVQNDVTEMVAAQERQERMQAELVTASRLAGMGEVAAGVLHNVGNVLNSLGVSAETLQAKLRGSRVGSLAKAVALMNEHRERIGEFMSEDPRGRKLPDYFRDLAVQMEKENADSRAEVDSIRQNLDHVARTIASQQSHAKQGGIQDENSLADVLDVAASLTFMDPHAAIEVDKQYEDMRPFLIDRHRLMQVLINLMRNARHAVLAPEALGDRRVIIRLWTEQHAEGPRAMMSVKDSGVGISEEGLKKIFSFGFTTKKTGNGYGLHSSANLMAEMGGGINVSSEGLGRGACFTLWLPLPAADGSLQGVA